MLNTYLQELISYAKKNTNAGLADYIRNFLDNTWNLPKTGVMGRAVNAAQVNILRFSKIRMNIYKKFQKCVGIIY